MQEQFSAHPSLDITAPPSWLLAEYRPSMDITAPPSWLLAEYRPSMDITAPPSWLLAETTGAIFSPSIPGHNRTAFLGSLRNTVHPWT